MKRRSNKSAKRGNRREEGKASKGTERAGAGGMEGDWYGLTLW